MFNQNKKKKKIEALGGRKKNVRSVRKKPAIRTHGTDHNGVGNRY